MTAFRLNEELVGCTVGKLDHFIFDGRAIPRPRALNLPGVEGRPVQISPNNLVSFGGGVSDPAGDLFHVERARFVAGALPRAESGTF